MKDLRVPCLCIALAFAPATAAQQPAPETATEFEPVIVTAPARPSWERSDELLRLLVEKSAPCLGCDTVVRARPATLTLQDYLLRPAGSVDEAATLARHVKLQDSPDLQYLQR